MSESKRQAVQRRTFLKLFGAAASASAVPLAHPQSNPRIVVVVDRGNPVIASEPVAWAIGKLQRAMISKGMTPEVMDGLSSPKPVALAILVAMPNSKLAVSTAPVPSFDSPESFALLPGNADRSPSILVCAADIRGFVYGLLELADRVQYGDSPLSSLHLTQPVIESTPNKVRSIARAFCSEVDDKPWFYNQAFWSDYLDGLAASRFNRFNLAFGFGYDFPRGVTGDYLHFPYPYLVAVPGYDSVRVDPPLEPGERERNLAALQFIAQQTALRGLHFQLGLWTHAYAWTDSPGSDHRILGLSAETHAAYCRDALAMILKACPQIQGLTFRVHGESGIPEGSYDFWQTLFDAIAGAGRPIEIDMHAKGLNQIMIDMGRKTGMAIKVGAKYSAEHMSLSYHQADIREQEIPRADRAETGTFNVSNGERRFTRYGYADFYQKGNGLDVLYRLWPGTQRHLIWGDPALAAGYGRAAHFCGAAGLEICEPLTFKGREGSGHTGGRCAYADPALNPVQGDAAKFAYTYRIWGRAIYNPDETPEARHRYLRHEFGDAAPGVETALASASRILPLVTSAYLPSAANHFYWPEMYTNMPLVAGSEASPYPDTDKPYSLATASPLDPQLFAPIGQYARDLLAENGSGRYSPLEVATWLDNFAYTANVGLTEARKALGTSHAKAPEFRRIEEDCMILIGLGRFYADLFRAGVLYAIFQESGLAAAGIEALGRYRKARATWSSMAERAKGVYVADVSYGDIPQRHGHWIDRIPGMDVDIAAMQKRVSEASSNPSASLDVARAQAALRIAHSVPSRPKVAMVHTPVEAFVPGNHVVLSLSIKSATVAGITLWYRHVDHGERWRSVPMEVAAGSYSATIPADYSRSPYPLQYYFELRSANAAWLHPAFNATLSNQPYFTITQPA